MNQPTHAPTLNAPSFSCPHCHAFSGMDWQWLRSAMYQNTGLAIAVCKSCNKASVWLSPDRLSEDPFAGQIWFDDGEMIFPRMVRAPAAHLLMPEEIKVDYEEARQIALISPRAAAALLRLCVDKLCKFLTGNDDRINDQIGQLVRNGLPVKIQQALDAVRVIGNNAVHPGVLDLTDTAKYVDPLFDVINIIVENQIAQPAAIAELYASLPLGQLDAIARRDTPKT